MGTQQMIDALFAELNSGKKMHEIMRENERRDGARVVVPGEVQWLSAADWHPTVVVSVAGRSVRLVAILANSPGNGAFRRTVAAIMAAGLVPTVIEPTHAMRATMKRWKWKCRHVGYGMNSEEQWRPRKSFQPTK